MTTNPDLTTNPAAVRRQLVTDLQDAVAQAISDGLDADAVTDVVTNVLGPFTFDSPGSWAVTPQWKGWENPKPEDTVKVTIGSVSFVLPREDAVRLGQAIVDTVGVRQVLA